jgi:plastocyanin
MKFPSRWRALAVALSPLLFFAVLVSLESSAAIEAAQPKTHTIEIRDMQFIPASLVVNSGDTVIWKNEDVVPHTATSTVKGFDSGGIEPGKSWTYVAGKKGSFPYACTYHPTMKATLSVR